MITKSPNKKLISKIKRKDTENELMTLAQLPTPLSSENQLKWIQMALVYFHSLMLDIHIIKNCRITSAKLKDMITIEYLTKSYSIPIYPHN